MMEEKNVVIDAHLMIEAVTHQRNDAHQSAAFAIARNAQLQIENVKLEKEKAVLLARVAELESASEKKE